MSAQLEHLLREAAPEGVILNIWPQDDGTYRVLMCNGKIANKVRVPDNEDAVEALTEALKQFVGKAPEPVPISVPDEEETRRKYEAAMAEMRAAATAPATDPLGGMFG